MPIKRYEKKIAFLLLVITLIQSLYIPMAFALTSGPTQPEVQSFEPAGTTQMVDVFSGDFTYNIPLFELPGPNGGYPFNLAYHAGIGMDQEASWVGLGWNLNPGAITRQMRGLPDEFKGDGVYTKTSMDPSVTVGIGAGASLEFLGGDPLKAALGLSVYNNNYKGVGYSIDGSLGFSVAAGSGKTAGVGLGFSLDNQEGVSLNPSLSLMSRNGVTFDKLGVGYNSRQGLKSLTYTAGEGVGKYMSDIEVSGSSYSLSLFNPGFTPQVSMPFTNTNMSAEVKLGGSWWGVFASPYLKGFYNDQRLTNNNVRVRTPAFGYLNYESSIDKKALLDFSREQDGMVRKESPNLPIPSLTYDIYSLNGQGIAAMYRPMRSDYGVIHDPEVESITAGGSIGGDVAPALSHVGGNLGVNYGKSASGNWTDKNAVAENFTFQKQALNDIYEPWYFKVHGEPSAQSTKVLSAIGGESAVRVKLESGGNPQAMKILESKTESKPAPNTATDNREREQRGEVITTLTNAQLLKGNQEVNALFKLSYLDESGNAQKYDRVQAPGHHMAGLTALNPNGLRYTYALPAYNLYQEEIQFSCQKPLNSALVTNGNNGGEPIHHHQNTDNYLNKTELPAYAHSYLLTSIVGPDYIDVTGDGVSADDLGYWVKFNYKQNASKSNPYKWRAPFSKSLYNEGLKTDPTDDRGSYVYGEKEIWHLASAETKSHIATFTTEERLDGQGVADKLQDTDQLGKKLERLKEIKLYTRFAGMSVPLKLVKFEYDYSLCPGVSNTSGGAGKLTLKKVWFEHGTSQRGKLNPYTFAYQTYNPNYDINAVDRWGNHKPHPANDPLFNKEQPYAEQDPAKKMQIDQSTAAWSLTEINLPSGGKIKVDYESDDYAYVQHRPAMQMTSIVDPYSNVSGSLSNKFNLTGNNPKLRFTLEKPIEGTLSTEEQKKEVLKYLDSDRKQLFFKIKINLRSSSENYHEFISGYADIDFNASMGLEKDGNGKYLYGYFHLVKELIKNKEGVQLPVHPFSLRAWQHIRTNQPDLASIGKKLKASDESGKRLNEIKGMASIFPHIKQMFLGFNLYCMNKGWGMEIMADKSWVRLKSPDLIKYGGGLRVKQITLADQWKHDEEGIYGQTYDYTITENGQKISSGVATYEPFIGGEENALRYAKKYTQTVPLASNNNLFFEFPVNEGYFPGASVGYRRVTVKSLASANLAGEALKNIQLSDGKKLFPQGSGINYGTSGETVHEFYTAKDFPVITNETEKINRTSNIFIPVPLLGTISTNNLTASQGYSIITNDMHGKPKKISFYRQANNGKIEPDAISWIQYNYMQTEQVYDGKKVNVLQNTFKEVDEHTIGLATKEELASSSISKFTIGQESEFFLDMREHTDNTWVGGVQLNVDILYIPVIFALVPLPFPMPWPNVTKSSNRLRTVVANKIIFKTGVLESVEAFDGGSLVKTQNLKWDKLTGKPLLTLVNNNYDAPVYSSLIPAYHLYKGMGAAYKNAGLSYSLSDIQRVPYKNNFYWFNVTDQVKDYLYAGDELILSNSNQQVIGTAIYVGKEQEKHMIYCDNSLEGNVYNALIMRSGNRNQLTVDAENITALKDPTGPKTDKTYSKTIQIPASR